MEQDVAEWESRDADGDPYGAVLGRRNRSAWDGRDVVQPCKCNAAGGKRMDADLGHDVSVIT
jgi:hypothetical protein